MSIRVALCLLFVVVFAAYAWRNWFVSLCAAIAMMAVLEHPDMPKKIAGIQGLNPWNFLMANVVGAWLLRRRSEGLTFDMPRHIRWLLVSYLSVIVISYLRIMANPSGLPDYTFMGGFTDYLINCLKFILPGLLLYDGCRTRSRVQIAVFVTLGVYFLLAVQVIRWMPLSYVNSGDRLAARAAKILVDEVGYHRVNLSMMLAGAFWAVLCTLIVVERKSVRLGLVICALVIFLGQALTGGRTGYVTWGAVGFFLCVVRWRKLLPLLPAAALLVGAMLPGVKERMLKGFGGGEGVIQAQTDDYQITSGRTFAWKFVIAKINESPMTGYGGQAMYRTGIFQMLMDEYEEAFAHPHNAYLQMLLDNGVLGLLAVIPFYIVILFHSTRLLIDRNDSLCVCVGGVSVALVLALLVASTGSQTFYPREGAVGMWAAMGLMLRVYTERKRARIEGGALFEQTELLPDGSSTEPSTYGGAFGGMNYAR